MAAVKVKTSVSLSRAVVEALDAAAPDKGQRSALVERAVVAYLERGRRKARDERDRQIIEQNADALNRDAAEWLDLVAAVNEDV